MSTPSRDTVVRTVDAYVAALDAGDPAAMAALFAEDAVHAEPMGSESRQGRAAIQEFFGHATSMGLDVSAAGPVTVSGRFAAVPLLVTVPGMDPFVTTDVFEIDESGQIVRFDAIPDLEARP